MLHELESDAVPMILENAVLKLSSKGKVPDNVKKFCWGIVASACSKITVDVSIEDTLKCYKSVLLLTSLVHTTSVVAEQEQSEHIKQYISWFDQLTGLLTLLYNRITLGACNFDELVQYQSRQRELSQLFNSVLSDEITPHIQKAISDFQNMMVELNRILVLSVPGVPDVFTTLFDILHRYSVTLPAGISKHLVPSRASFSDDMSLNAAQLETIVQSKTHHNLCIHVTKCTQIQTLYKLVSDLSKFVQPIKQYTPVLAYFQLNHSLIFNQYMETEIKKLLEPEAAKNLKKHIWDFNVDTETQIVQRDCSVHVLAEAASKVITRIIKLLEGTLTYVQIHADGLVDLRQLDADKEFRVLDTLAKSNHLNIKGGGHRSLNGFRELLEIFQLPEYIDCIHEICKQYNLSGCIEDPTFIQVLKTSKYLKSAHSKEEMTPIKAVDVQNELKIWLCNNQPKVSIELFKTMKHCTPFYDFIQEMKFNGKNGKILFTQQYQLVTNELQHEEYNENMLNHLTAAYDLITPFLDAKQNFKSLMTQVAQLDVSNDLSKLWTINENIETIHNWFSKVEVSLCSNSDI